MTGLPYPVDALPGSDKRGVRRGPGPAVLPLPVPPALIAHLTSMGARDITGWSVGECQVLVGWEPVAAQPGAYGCHLSISHPSRYPGWDEIVAARYRLCPPDAYMAMVLPPAGEYVDLHPRTFQLHEVRS